MIRNGKRFRDTVRLSMIALVCGVVVTASGKVEAQVQQVDLSTWTAESYPAVSGFGGGVWTVAPDGLSVYQSVNGQPTLFYSDFSAFNTSFRGKVRVETAPDDDFIGFALGFQPGDSSNASAAYLLIDWKMGNQSFNFGSPSCTPGGLAPAGLAVSRVFGIPTADEFWVHTNFNTPACSDLSNGLQELQRGASLGSTGWADFIEYEFRFDFNATSLKVFVDGNLELDITGTFSDGRIAFYNFSQSCVRYSGFTILPLGACCDPSQLSCEDGVLEADCPAGLEWTEGTSCADLVPLCAPDCNSNGRDDADDIACGAGSVCGGLGGSDDCNENGIPDECDIADSTSVDCQPNGIPDECEVAGVGGSVFLTGHDPDFHAVDLQGPRNINIAAIDFVMDPLFNPFVAANIDKFLFVQSNIAVPGGHRNGVNGIIASGFVSGTDFEQHNASTLNAELDKLGTTYGAIVVASDFGGILTQAELDILNARSADIIDFLNDGGGLYAMAESNSQAGLTPNGGHFAFLPFVVSSTQFNQSEAGTTVTPFGASLGLTDADVNVAFSHNIFTATSGLSVVDFDGNGNIMSLAGRGVIDPSGLVDCNGNGIPDECDVADGTSPDCNSNGIPDECDIASGNSQDANNDGVPDECNTPPVCDAGGSYGGECTGATTSFALDGTASSDPDPGDTLTFSWTTDCAGGVVTAAASATPVVTTSSVAPCPPLTCNVSLTVTDNSGASDSCGSTVTVTDTTPPDFTSVPVAVTVTDVDCSGDEAVTLGAATATDDCGTVTITDDAPATFPAGQTTTVTFTATDDCGNSSSASVDVTVLFGADIWVTANKHTVGSGSNPGSTKEPFVGIEICAYDKADGSCARDTCGGISHQHYECIATTCTATNCCRTDADGMCNLNLPPGDYVVISLDATKTTLPDPLGVSASDLVCGEHKQKHLQQIVKIKSDGSTKKVPGKTTRRTGSELLIIEPEYVIWDGTVQEYPFVFETVGDWDITASVTPPEGFVSDYGSLSADVYDDIQAVQFTITEVGSDLVPTGTTFEVTHKGRSEIIHSQVGIFLTAEYARARGFNVAQLRAAGLIKELPDQAGFGQSHR